MPVGIGSACRLEALRYGRLGNLRYDFVSGLVLLRRIVHAKVREFMVMAVAALKGAKVGEDWQLLDCEIATLQGWLMS